LKHQERRGLSLYVEVEHCGALNDSIALCGGAFEMHLMDSPTMKDFSCLSRTLMSTQGVHMAIQSDWFYSRRNHRFLR